MKVTETINKRKPMTPKDVAVGAVYSWGQRSVWYMRTPKGAVVLNGYDVGMTLTDSNASHFATTGVVVATTADLNVGFTV